MLDSRRDDMNGNRREERAEQGRIVGFCTAGSEQNFPGNRTNQLRYLLPGLFEQLARTLALGMHARSVAESFPHPAAEGLKNGWMDRCRRIVV